MLWTPPLISNGWLLLGIAIPFILVVIGIVLLGEKRIEEWIKRRRDNGS